MEESHPLANRFSLSDIIVRVLIWYLISFPSKIRQITPAKVQETQMFKIELKKIFLIELSMFVPRSEENIRDHASLITIDLTQIDYDSVKVLWSKGHKPLPPLHPLLIKGRNLYRLNTLRRARSCYICHVKDERNS